MSADNIESRCRLRQMVVVSQAPGPSQCPSYLTRPGTSTVAGRQPANAQNPASQQLPDLQAKRWQWHGMASIMAVLKDVVLCSRYIDESYDLVDTY